MTSAVAKLIELSMEADYGGMISSGLRIDNRDNELSGIVRHCAETLHTTLLVEDMFAGKLEEFMNCRMIDIVNFDDVTAEDVKACLFNVYVTFISERLGNLLTSWQIDKIIEEKILEFNAV